MVFSSIHTADVASTINRLVSFFPPEEQLTVRARLADNLRAVVSLRLLPNKKSTGARAGRRADALDRAASRSASRIPRRPTRSTTSSRKGRPENMQTFDQHLLDLLRANKISVETAMAAASNPTDFKTKLALEGGDPDAAATLERIIGPMEIESDERF